MKNIRDLGNGNGYIYITEQDGTTILNNLINNTDGVRQARNAALICAGLQGEVLAHAEITFSATVSGTVSQILVNGVNQIGGSVSTSGTIATDVIAMRDAVNSTTPVSGPNYTAQANGDVLQLICAPGYGGSVNGQSVSISATSGTNSTTTTVYGGNDANSTVDKAFGLKFWLDAGYGSGSISGQGTANPGDVSHAIDITEYLVMRGLQSKLDEQSSTLANNTLTVDRTMSIESIYIDTFGGGATDDLKTIAPSNWVFGDILILRGLDSGRVTTVHHTSGAGENIYLQSSTSFSTGTSNNVLILQYINDAGTAKWVEVARTPNIAPTISVSILRGDGIIIPVQGVNTVTVLNTGGTLTLVPGTDKGYQKITGSPTLSANYTITTGGSPTAGDRFVIEYKANISLNSHTVTIFGISLTSNQAANGSYLFTTTYNGSGWDTYMEADFSASNIVETSHIKDANVTLPKLTGSPIQDTMPINCSFESGEVGATLFIPFAYQARIDKVSYTVVKAIAGTDDALIHFTTSSGAIAEYIDIPAGSAQNSTGSITPTANSTIGANTSLQILNTKSTAGGKVIITLALTKV